MTDKRDDILFRPWKDLKRLRDRKLHQFITKHLYPFSAYYRNVFDKNKIKPDSIRTAVDLSRIPFTSKRDFIDLPKEDATKRNLEFLLQPNEELIRKYLPKSTLANFFLLSLLKGKDYLKGRLEREYKPIFVTATAGTTEQPISFLYTDYDIENLKFYGHRMVDIFNVTRQERLLNVFPYAPHLAFWQTVFAGLSSNIFTLSTGGGKTLGTEGNIRSILKVKPQFLIGVPSYVYHILKTAHEQNLKMSFLTSITLGASRVPQGFKKKISNLLNDMGASKIAVLGTYGFTEARAAWAECPTDIDVSSGYHTYPDKEVFEVIDPKTGDLKREGEDGELVYTAIDARGTCVIRYRTGDLVKGGISYSPCPHCGRTSPRISSDIVRASNVKDLKLSKIKGALVNLNTLEHMLDDIEDIDEWQIEIAKKDNDPYEVDELNLYISLLKDLDREAFIRRINQEVLYNTEISFNKISFVSRDEIQRRIEIESAVKAKKIIDKRPNI